MNYSKTIKKLGQSVWYDNIERAMLFDGRMKSMIENGEIYGVTSNPSIFEAALKNSLAYDEVLQSMSWAGKTKEEIYSELVTEDIRAAADLFLSVYEENDGLDGLVSVEINPFLAHDVKKSIEEGRQLWAAIDRKNLMIKVPATLEGLKIIRALISDGINVNATLIFSNERYRQVIDAYLSGLEDRFDKGLPIDRIMSVASFFVSRIDSAIDPLLEGKAEQSKGKIAIANAKLAYQLYLSEFSSERFGILERKGANHQKPLWASTSTKNPDFPDTIYVDNLIARNSVNTIPPKTLEAFLDHGVAELTIENDLNEAKTEMTALAYIGIDFAEACEILEDEGVEKFEKAYASLLEIIESKRLKYLQDIAELTDNVQKQFHLAEEEKSVSRLYAHDPAFWTNNQSGWEEIRNRLGWLDLPHKQLAIIPELEAFRDELLKEGFTHAFVLGMGGSSLAPEVISHAIGSTLAEGQGLKLKIIDTTNPEEISVRCYGVDIRKALFIVSSKSGGTSETISAMKYFWAELKKIGVENPGKNFIAITDPGTSLEARAKEMEFRRVFSAPEDVGGRFSVFTVFGLLPAAIMGVDMTKFLTEAIEAEALGRESVPYAANPNLLLGLLIGAAAKAGKDKLTFITEDYASKLVPWLEQLIAESSGKDGKGILPIENEAFLDSLDYPKDRIFVYLSVDNEKIEFVEKLRQEGYPVIELPVRNPYQLAKEFYRWEYATAIACAVLQVNAFDQPNVQLSKTITKEKIVEYQEKGRLEEGRAIWENSGFAVYGENLADIADAKNLLEVIDLFLKDLAENGYIAINAFVPRLKDEEAFLQALRTQLLNRYNRATTLGFGPRFLHSTGQFHKGGLDSGHFITITNDPKKDFDIPDEKMTFGTLQRAQALGDIEALRQKGKKVVRIHLK